MILFKKLRWKNLLSTGNVFTEIELDKNKTTLVVGENGSGKSTMLDALSFVLFNKPFRKINKPQLVNTITQKGLVVEVEFSIAKVNYKIIRGIKPTVFEVYKNDSLLNQSAESKDYQEILEKQILKVNHKSFCQVVVLGSATFLPFMQLPAAQRREIIEDLLDLQIFSVMNTILKDDISHLSQQIMACDNNIKLTNDRIKLLKEHILSIQNNNEKLFDEKKERVNEANDKISQQSELYYQISNKIKDFQENLEDDDKLNKRLKKLSELKYKIEAKLNTLNSEVHFFNKHDDCPTCKQPIDVQFKCDTIEVKQKEITEINDGLDKLTDQYTELNTKIKEIMTINSKVQDLKLQEHSVKVQINSLIDYRENIENEMKNLKSQTSKDEIKKIKEYENELTKLSDEFNNLSEQKIINSFVSSFLKDSGIKAKIIKQYIPVINKLINKYLSSMEFMCQFELNEEFNETIKSRYRDEFSYSSFSEGEKMRINLAILFSWRAIAKLRNSINTNLLIMDEVFDSSLDSNGTEEFMKILIQLTKDTNTFIISHKTDQLYDKFERVIKFEKHKNFSKVVA